MKSDIAELIAFVLEQSQDVPLQRRAKLFRALAAICGDPEEEKQLSKIANDLSATDALCRQFNFSFVQRNSV